MHHDSLPGALWRYFLFKQALVILDGQAGAGSMVITYSYFTNILFRKIGYPLFLRFQNRLISTSHTRFSIPFRIPHYSRNYHVEIFPLIGAIVHCKQEYLIFLFKRQ